MTETSRFYFSLPRLWAKWVGQDAMPTENNWLEANAVGLCMHLVVYAFVLRSLLGGRDLWLQLLFALPLAVLVWILWLLLFYFGSLIVKAARAIGFMRALSDRRAQSFVLMSAIGLLALALSFDHSLYKIIGLAWLALVALNLLAAAVLSSNVSTAE